MRDLELFLVHAIELERDAARRYEDLTQVMHTAGNREVAVFFKKMAEYSRMHLQEAMSRGGFHDLPRLAPHEFHWPEGFSPEAAAWEGVDGLIDVRTALQIALEGETRSLAYYRGMAAVAQDPEVRRAATEFADEEAQHVRDLEHWMARVDFPTSTTN